jgi:hypothetical protein
MLAQLIFRSRQGGVSCDDINKEALTIDNSRFCVDRRVTLQNMLESLQDRVGRTSDRVFVEPFPLQLRKQQLRGISLRIKIDYECA